MRYTLLCPVRGAFGGTSISCVKWVSNLLTVMADEPTYAVWTTGLVKKTHPLEPINQSPIRPVCFWTVFIGGLTESLFIIFSFYTVFISFDVLDFWCHVSCWNSDWTVTFQGARQSGQTDQCSARSRWQTHKCVDSGLRRPEEFRKFLTRAELEPNNGGIST